MAKLWTEFYRPKTLNEYVFRDKRQKEQINEWIKDKIIPQVIFAGPAGTGKTSLAWILIKELGIQDGDVLEINCAEETSIDVIRNKVLGFSSSMAWGNFKIVLLEEASELSVNGLNSLKRIIESTSDNCRFIFTTNHLNKIIAPIQSRCQIIQMNNLDEESFRIRLAEILVDNNIEFDLYILDNYIRATLPDLRKAINSIQQNSIKGVLQSPNSDSGSKADYMPMVLDLFKKGKITEGRIMLCENATEAEIPEIYRMLYRNLDIFGTTISKQEQAIVIIRDGLVKDTICADREICLSATICQLKLLRD